MIPIYQYRVVEDEIRVRGLLDRLRLDPKMAVRTVKELESVHAILSNVASHGDSAIVEISQRFDDPGFEADQIRVTEEEMRAAAKRLPARQMKAIRRSIAQVREYQAHIMPKAPKALKRPGVTLGLRFVPIESVGLCVPGGKAAYPSTVIMLAVPAQVAGVSRIVVCTPPSKFGRSDIVLATCHELGLTEVFRAGGAAAVGAMAFGTRRIRAVEKIVGPGNAYVQHAKRAVAGYVGVDGFLGPSEILTLADETGRAEFIAADMLAQAEHDPGSCFLLTTSQRLAEEVVGEVERQIRKLARTSAIMPALRDHSAIVVHESMDALIYLANEFACEHVNIQTANDKAVLKKLRNGGAIFVGPWSPVAAGDYVAGPSHCLPTNTTARFASGVSVYEFLKRVSVETYDAEGLATDAEAIITLAGAESLDAHAASVRIRGKKSFSHKRAQKAQKKT